MAVSVLVFVFAYSTKMLLQLQAIFKVTR